VAVNTINQPTYTNLIIYLYFFHLFLDIFVYGDDTKGLFFKLVGIIEKLGLDIVDAKILTSKDNKAYNTISVISNW
jgi:[protein-PII] uridylyltransferase